MSRYAIVIIGLLPAAVFAQRATFQGIGELPGFGDYRAVGVSADGRVAIAHARDLEGYIALRWTAAGGLETLEPPAAGSWAPRAVSADGSVIVVAGNRRAFRWTRATGMVDIGDVPGGSGSVSPQAISDDGLVIAGTAEVSRVRTAFRWTEATGAVPLFPFPQSAWVWSMSGDGATVGGQFQDLEEQGFLWTEVGDPQLLGEGNVPGGMSYDGSVVVGWYHPGHEYHAFRWTAATGIEFMGTSHSMANDVSADGSVVVGTDNFHITLGTAFVWDRASGLRSLKSVMADDYGIDLTGWELWSANGVSADGTVIVGWGENPAGQEEGWIARLGNGPCYADCDASGVIDFFDFLCFQEAFVAAEPWADCDGSGELDVFDFLCFQNAFVAGCP